MIADLLNTLVGLGLTYLAIFPQAGAATVSSSSAPFLRSCWRCGRAAPMSRPGKATQRSPPA